MAEIGMVLEDLNCAIKNVKKWSKKDYKLSPLAQFPSTSFRIAEPYGIVLNPMLASIFMTISSLTVVFNSLRLRWMVK